MMSMKSITWHILVVGLLISSPISAAETIYRCDDGSFTNRADAECAHGGQAHGNFDIRIDFSFHKPA